MLIRLYSIYDRVARVYSDPFVSVNDATASRTFTLALSNHETLRFTCPEDYQLWYLGSMDNNSGEILSSDPPECEPYKVCDGQPREVIEHE